MTPSNTDAGGMFLDVGWASGGQGPFRFGIGGSEKMRIDSSGNVGIGTTNGDIFGRFYTRSVGIDSAGITKIQIDGASYTGIDFGVNGTRNGEINNTSTSFGINTIDARPLTFTTNNTERMRIDSSGTTTMIKSSAGASTTPLVVRNSGSTVVNTESKIFLSTVANDDRGAYISAKITDSSNGNALILATNTAGSSPTERMRIDSSGRVGIGTSSPDFLLSTSGTGTNRISVNSTDSGTSGVYFRVLNGGSMIGNGTIATQSNGDMKFFTGTSSEAERMLIDTSGGVSIGHSSTSPDRLRLYEGANNNVGIFFQTATSGVGGSDGFRVGQNDSNAFLWNYEATPLSFATSGSERVRITSGGDILVGTTSKGYGLFSSSRLTIGDGDSGDGVCIGGLIQNNSAYTTQADNNTGTRYFAYIANGSSSVVGTISFTSTATAYNTSSDYRLKENVVDLTGALDRVDQLEPKRFNFIADEDTTVDGFLAHEVQDIVPEAVTGEKDAVDDEGNPEYQGIDQSKIVPLLVGAIKELKAEIETLKSQINS